MLCDDLDGWDGNWAGGGGAELKQEGISGSCG